MNRRITANSMCAIKGLMITFLVLTFHYCTAQSVIPLYEGKIPNSKEVKDEEQHVANSEVDSLTNNVSVPTISAFFPEKGRGNGTAVIICPGGGYHTLLTKREGSDVASAFNKLGVTAFVLKYRLPNDRTMVDKSIGPFQDAQQAILLVRKNAGKWRLDPTKIGIMGFSAGGHLAAMTGTHIDGAGILSNSGLNTRPDFMLLINPVISMTDEIGHIGSRNFLLGGSPLLEKINLFSNELQVTSATPPTFLVHSNEDQVVSVENSLRFYQALRKHGIAVGMHLYAKGEHGFLSQPSFEEWFGRCIYWMKSMHLIKL
ncbi:acetyl esterase/lipase [Pedobacter sp. UYP24]